MKLRQFDFEYEEYSSAEELNSDDILLLNKAKHAIENAYAPYSNFKVASAARLINGSIITATNQENASFPAGICAERNLLAVASSLYPSTAIETITITYKNENGANNHPISPCGICRQSLLEYEERMKHPIRLILSGIAGKIFIVNSAKSLLPLSFTSNDLK
jgi:cytidine deaminase